MVETRKKELKKKKKKKSEIVDRYSFTKLRQQELLPTQVVPLHLEKERGREGEREGKGNIRTLTV